MEAEEGHRYPRQVLRLHQSGGLQLPAQRRPVRLRDPGNLEDHVLHRPAVEHPQPEQQGPRRRVEPVERQLQGGDQLWPGGFARLPGRRGRTGEELLQPLAQLGGGAGLELTGEHPDRKRVEAGLVEQVDQLLPPGGREPRRRGELAELGEPLQGVVRRRPAPQPRELDPAVDPRPLHPVAGMSEVRPPGGEQNARAAGLRPAHRRVQQLAQRLRRERFQVVEDHQGRSGGERPAGGLGVGQALLQDASQRAHRHRQGVGALERDVVDEDHGLEHPGAQQPAAGLLGEEGLALPAEAGQGEPPGGAGEPLLDLPELAAPAVEALLRRRPEVAAESQRGGGRVLFRRRSEERHVVASLVKGGHEPVLEGEPDPPVLALHLILLRVLAQVAPGVIETLADTAVAGQLAVEGSEKRPSGGHQHGMGHRQHRRQPGPGQPSGHTPHGPFGRLARGLAGSLWGTERRRLAG